MIRYLRLPLILICAVLAGALLVTSLTRAVGVSSLSPAAASTSLSTPSAPGPGAF